MEMFLSYFEAIAAPLIVTGVFLFLFFLLHLVLRWKYKEQHKKSLLSQLLFFALSIIAVISLVVSMPINPTLRGQILGILGLLLSGAIALSATTLLGNALAGLMMRGVRNFSLGDFVELDGNFGRVTERGLFHIEIQTQNRNLVTLPNLIMVTNPLEVFQSTGTMVTTQVSLGYDVGHEKVKRLLTDAALKTGLEDPFVFVLELGDFSVLYKVSGLLLQTEKILSMRSKLNEEVMIALHADSIEIVSPVFENQRIVQSQKFIARAEKVETVAKLGDHPEKSVFDKAEQAGQLTLKEEEHASNGQLITALKDQVKAADNEPDKIALQQKISRLEKSQEIISEEIKSLSIKLEEDITQP